MKIDWEHIPTINACRVSLRPLTENDKESIYAVYSDPEVMRYWGGAPMKNLGDATNFLIEVRSDLQRRSCIQWGLARRADNRIVGTVAFFHLDCGAGKAEIGFALGQAHWGMGYMREALQAVIAYAFTEMDLRRIEADVDPRNLSSIGLLERLGFQKEGYLRERWVVSGETQDALFYGLLRREWNSTGTDYEVLSRPDCQKHFSPFTTRLARSRLRRWAALILGMISQ